MDVSGDIVFLILIMIGFEFDSFTHVTMNMIITKFVIINIIVNPLATRTSRSTES